MKTFLTCRWETGPENPTEDDLRAALEELATPDAEHPDCWLTDENGWTVSAFESGNVVLENLESGEGPWHIPGQSSEAVLELRRLLQAGQIETIRSRDWIGGYPAHVEAEW